MWASAGEGREVTQDSKLSAIKKKLAVANSRAIAAEVRLFRQEEETGAVRMQYDRLQDALGRLYAVGHAIEPPVIRGADSDFVKLITAVKDLRELSAALFMVKPFLKPQGRSNVASTQR